MSLIIHVETSTKACSVALAEEGKLIASDFKLFEQYAHAESLNPMIMNVMKMAGKSFNQLKAVAVSEGPGSYTGLRIGVSSAKGFCYGLNIPLIAVSTLQVLSAVAKNKMNENNSVPIDNQMQFIPMLDARRMEVYTAVFDHDLKRLENDKAIVVDENFANRFSAEKTVFFGDGMEKCRTLLVKNTNAILIENIYPNAEQMISFAWEKFQKSEFEDLAYYEPEYLKEFNSH